MKQIQLHDFNGGVHPLENKIQSTTLEILDASIPEKLILPIAQHIGAPSKPIVSPGDMVLKGQLIAQGEDFVSCNLHAPTSGTIGEITLKAVPHQSNMSAQCIELITAADYFDFEEDDRVFVVQELPDTCGSHAVFSADNFDSFIIYFFMTPLSSNFRNSIQKEFIISIRKHNSSNIPTINNYRI